MLIDWFTVLAQAINFLILVWLMKRFLYKPLLHAIDEREKRVTTEITEAALKKSAAEKENLDFKKKNEAFEQERAALLAKANSDARAAGERMLEDAKKAAADFGLKQQNDLRSERDALQKAMGQSLLLEVFAIARKVLKDLAGANLDEQVVDLFIQRLRELKPDEKTILAASMRTSPVLIRTSFQLQAAQQASLAAMVKELSASEIPPQFKTDPDLIGGIDLSAGWQKLSWNISDYLNSMKQNATQLGQTRATVVQPRPPTPPTAQAAEAGHP